MACPSGDGAGAEIVEMINMPVEFKTGREGYRCVPVLLGIPTNAPHARPQTRSRIPIPSSTPCHSQTPSAFSPEITPGPSGSRIPIATPRSGAYSNPVRRYPTRSRAYESATPSISSLGSPSRSAHSGYTGGTSCSYSYGSPPSSPSFAPSLLQSPLPPIGASSPYMLERPDVQDVGQQARNCNYLLDRNRECKKMVKHAKHHAQKNYAETSPFTREYTAGILAGYEQDIDAQYQRVKQAKRQLYEQHGAPMDSSNSAVYDTSDVCSSSPGGLVPALDLQYTLSESLFALSSGSSVPSALSPDTATGFRTCSPSSASPDQSSFLFSSRPLFSSPSPSPLRTPPASFLNSSSGCTPGSPLPSPPGSPSFNSPQPCGASTPAQAPDPGLLAELDNYNALIEQNRECLRGVGMARELAEEKLADVSSFTRNYMFEILDSYERDIETSYQRALEVKEELLSTLRK